MGATASSSDPGVSGLFSVECGPQCCLAASDEESIQVFSARGHADSEKHDSAADAMTVVFTGGAAEPRVGEGAPAGRRESAVGPKEQHSRSSEPEAPKWERQVSKEKAPGTALGASPAKALAQEHSSAFSTEDPASSWGLSSGNEDVSPSPLARCPLEDSATWRDVLPEQLMKHFAWVDISFRAGGAETLYELVVLDCQRQGDHMRVVFSFRGPAGSPWEQTVTYSGTPAVAVRSAMSLGSTIDVETLEPVQPVGAKGEKMRAPALSLTCSVMGQEEIIMFQVSAGIDFRQPLREAVVEPPDGRLRKTSKRRPANPADAKRPGRHASRHAALTATV